MEKFVDTHAIEQQCLAEWRADAKLREEFCGDFETFKAYRTAEAQGIVHVRTGQVEGGQRR